MPRGLRLAAVLAGLGLAVPLWVGRFVPLLDLPQHLAVVAVLRNHGDPTWGFARFFDVQWGEFTPYWSFYLATGLLSWTMSVETAARVYLTVYALAFPWAGIAVCRAFGRSPWLGLLAAPLALNTNLYLGFISYATGVLGLLLLLAVFEGHRQEAAPRRAALLVVGGIVLFFTHVQAFAFFVAAALLLAATQPALAWRARAGRLLPLLPALLGLLAPWLYIQFVAAREGVAGRYTFGRLARLRASFQPPGEALADLPESIAGAFQDGSDLCLLGAWLVLVVWARPGLRRPRVLLPALLALVLYFAAPMSIAGQWNIGPRFAWLAALCVLPALQVSEARATAVGAMAAVLAIATGVNAARVHVAFDREAGALDEALSAIPRGTRVMALVFDPRGAVLDKWPYLHAGQYAMVRRGGMTAANLGRVPVFPIRLREAPAYPSVDAFRPGDFRWETMGSAYDYFLLRSPGEWRARLFPAEAVESVFERGEWVVLRRRGAVL